MEIREYQNLLLHMEWADALVWSALLRVPALARDKGMRERLYHFHYTQRAYLQLLQGITPEKVEFDRFPDLQSIGGWVRQFYRELSGYRNALDEAKLRQNVTFPWAGLLVERLGGAGPATAGESILQMALHTAHHRGQVVSRLREAGGEPPLVDFIAWVWMMRPAPQWGSLDADFQHPIGVKR